MRLLSYLTPGFPASLFEVLGDVIGADVVYEQRTSGPRPDENPLADGTVDLAWLCSTSYVDLLSRRGPPTVALVGVAWVPDDPGSGRQPVYFGDVVVRSDSDVRSLDELENQRIGCNDPMSLSGHHSLRLALLDRGLDPDDFAHLRFTGGHLQSLESLLAGEVDGAVVDSVVFANRSARDPRLASVSVAERLGPWPVQPLVARTALGAERIADIRRRLLAANDREDVQRELRAASLSHLVPVPASDYDQVFTAMEKLEHPPACR